jgi:hypothetical protein
MRKEDSENKTKIQNIPPSQDDEDEGGGHGGGGGHESDEHLWLYSFNDMLFNLLLFFIVMFAISSVNKARFAAVAEAMQIPKGEKEKGRPVTFQKQNSMVRGDAPVDTFVQCTNPLIPNRKEGTESGKQGTFPGKAPSETPGKSQAQRNKVFEAVFQGSELFVSGTHELSPTGTRILGGWARRTSKNGRMSRIEVETNVYSKDLFQLKDQLAAMDSKKKRNFGWDLASLRGRVVMDTLVQNGVPENLVLITARGPSLVEIDDTPSKSAPSAKVVVRLVEAWVPEKP